MEPAYHNNTDLSLIGVLLSGLPEGYRELIRDVLACAFGVMYVTRQRAERSGTAVNRVEAVLEYIDRRWDAVEGVF